MITNDNTHTKKKTYEKHTHGCLGIEVSPLSPLENNKFFQEILFPSRATNHSLITVIVCLITLNTLLNHFCSK